MNKHTKKAPPPLSWIDLSGCNLMSEELLHLISYRDFRGVSSIICRSFFFIPLTSQQLQQNHVKHLADIILCLKDL